MTEDRFNDRQITCPTHGISRAAYVCSHTVTSLHDSQARGFFWSRDEDGCVNAWCEACDDVLERTGGSWNEEAEAQAQIKLVCETCAGTVAALNGIDELD